MLVDHRQRRLRKLLRLYLMLREARRRDFGVHPILQHRSAVGQFAALYQRLRSDADKFYTYTRMNVPAFDKLLDLLEQRYVETVELSSLSNFHSSVVGFARIRSGSQSTRNSG